MSTFIASRRTSSAWISPPWIGPWRYFGKQDRHLGADPRARGAVGLAVVVVLDLDLAGLRDAVDVEEAEAQALHAVGAAVEVDDRKPRFPLARLVDLAIGPDGLDQRRHPVGRLVADVPEPDPASGFGADRLGRLALGETAEHRQRVAVVGAGRSRRLRRPDPTRVTR